jgi:hypothetical protein
MHFPQFLGALNGLALVSLASRTSFRLTCRTSLRICSTYVLVWANLVFTALIASIFSALDQVGVYFGISLALAAGLELLVWARQVPRDLSGHGTSRSAPDRMDRVVTLLLGIVLAGVALGVLLICLRYLPNNPDTCAYRLSRPFFYLAHGNLLHPGHTPDPRLSYYPFNGTLLYVFLAIYQFPALSFNFVSALTWLCAGLAVYVLAGLLGASRTGSLIAAWVCMLTPNVLVQAASGNDEILAATPLLIGLVFGVLWLQSGQRRYALLAGAGIGLGMGTKLHWAFYWTFVVLAAGAIVLHWLRSASFRAQTRARLPAVLAAAALAAPLAGSFLVCNYISSKQFTDSAFNDEVLNTPFSFALAKEKAQTSTGEMLLSPFPDLVPPLRPILLQAAYRRFNRFFMQCCFSNLVLTTKRSKEGYQFIGPSDQYAFAPAETTVWLGFLPHFMILAAILLAFARKLPAVGFVLIAAFFMWHLTYAVETRYIWWACTYYCFPAILSVAAVALVWDSVRSMKRTMSRCLLACFFGLFGTHMLLAANLMTFGSLRNVQFLLHPGRPIPDYSPVDPRVAMALRMSPTTYIPTTHWEVFFWTLMRYNPSAKYSTGGSLENPDSNTLMLLSIAPNITRSPDEGTVSAQLAVRLPPGSGPALTFLGDANGDHMFAQGDRIEARFPAQNRYALLDLSWHQDPATGAIVGADATCCVGLQASDHVAFRYAFESAATGNGQASQWFVAGQGSSMFSLQRNTGYDTLVLETRTGGPTDAVEQTVYPLAQEQYVVGKKEFLMTAQSHPAGVTNNRRFYKGSTP